jgi:hypothetical protein
VLVDWEEASSAGPPFEDLFHFVVQSHALLGRPSRDEVMRGLVGEGRVGRAFHAYAEAAELDVGTINENFADYLEHSQARLDVQRPDGQAGVRARKRLLRVLGVS